MKITCTPALKPEIRHKLQRFLAAEVAGVGEVDGGEQNMDGTACSIYIYPVGDKTEMDLRMALTGSFDEPPWPLPLFDPDNLPTEVPE